MHDRSVAAETATSSLPKGAVTAVVLVTLANSCNYMDRTLISALSSPIQKEFALNDSELGLLTGFAFIMTYVVIGFPIARLADRYSRKLVMSVSIAAWSALTACCGLTNSFLQLAAARMGVGVGEAGCQPTGYSILSDFFPIHRRPLILGLFQAGGMIGVTAGLSFGGYLGAAFGWRGAFFIMAIPGLVLALLTLFVLRDPPRPAAHTAMGPVDLRTNFTMLIKNRPYVLMVILMAMTSFTLFSLIQWMPAFFIRSHGMNLHQVGVIFGPTFGAGIMSGMLAGGWLGGRLARHSAARSLSLCRYTALALPCLALPALWIDNIQIALVLTAASAFCCALFSAPVTAAIAEATPPSIRASAFAIVSLMGSLFGVAGGPFVVGLLSDLFEGSAGAGSLRIAMTITIPLCFITAIVFRRAERALDAAASAN